MRHVEDLARAAFGRGIARYSAFLERQGTAAGAGGTQPRRCAGRELPLRGRLARGRAPGALPEPEDCYPACPVCCVRLQVPRAGRGTAARPQGLSGQPDGPRASPGGAGRHRPAAGRAGHRLSVRAGAGRSPHLSGAAQRGPHRGDGPAAGTGRVPQFAEAERRLQTATVSSLRLDAVLAAMLRCSRGMAAELVAAGRVEINHLPASSAHAPVYPSDVFTVRGKGRFRLTALPGKSKKRPTNHRVLPVLMRRTRNKWRRSLC